MDKKLEWLKTAEMFAADGDPYAMRGAANEILELDENSADGIAVKAEAALYLNEIKRATTLVNQAFSYDKNNLRGRLIAGGIAAKTFNITTSIQLLRGVADDARRIIDELENLDQYGETLLKIFLAKKILYKALCWLSNGLYIAGYASAASDALYEASGIAEKNDAAMELYSKHLFLRNYRVMPPDATKRFAEGYNKFFADVKPVKFNPVRFMANKKLNIGYISPDFRKHAVLNFIMPLIKYLDPNKFAVTCYYTNKDDKMTYRLTHLRTVKFEWRELIGYSLEGAVQLIQDDEIDILIDLSGHTQNSCLPILAHKPAPVQISMLGYTKTTGLNTIDYFISDVNSTVENPADFTEKIYRLPVCHLCYYPMQKMPLINRMPPIFKNKFVTFGSFNNFAKVSDEVLNLWRVILDEIPDAVLVLKNKACSIDSGREIVKERLRGVGISVDRVKMRPYSPDYLKQYNDIDIALDPFPYNGGATTCEALYMGVPVISLRGNCHASNFGTTILTAANLPEFIADTPEDYINKAVKLGRDKDLIANYHSTLRSKVANSPLMDERRYAKDLEKCYRDIWMQFCI